MSPTKFPQANTTYGPPEGMDKSQVQSIPAFCGQVMQGGCEGATMVVVAWKPTAEDLTRLQKGEPIFLTCLGGLPPHILSTRFEDAINLG